MMKEMYPRNTVMMKEMYPRNKSSNIMLFLLCSAEVKHLKKLQLRNDVQLMTKEKDRKLFKTL